MLTFPKILARALLITAGAILCDAFASYGTSFLGFSFVEVMGDLMLVEVAILFLVAGIVDFSSSVGAAHLRQAVLGSKQEYSAFAHKEAERKAVVLVLAGAFMFLILVVIGVAVLSHT
jgi:hypothetical protein